MWSLPQCSHLLNDSLVLVGVILQYHESSLSTTTCSSHPDTTKTNAPEECVQARHGYGMHSSAGSKVRSDPQYEE